MSDVRALAFDIFGTTVDWRSGIAAEAQRIGSASGVDADWERLADAWRALYMPSMNRVRSGELLCDPALLSGIRCRLQALISL